MFFYQETSKGSGGGGATQHKDCVSVCLTDTAQAPEAWEHSESVSASLHINSALKGNQTLCLRGRRRFELLSNTLVFVSFCCLSLSPPPPLRSLLLYVLSYLRSKKLIWENPKEFLPNNNIFLEMSWLSSFKDTTVVKVGAIVVTQSNLRLD